MGAGGFQRKASALFEGAGEQIGERISSLIGATVAFQVKQIFPVADGNLPAKVRKKAAVLLLEAASENGKGVAIFRVTDAVYLAATLLMMPPAQVAELIHAGEMGQDLADAFTEVANILYGALDDITVKTSPEKGKLRNEGIQLVDPASEAEFSSACPSGNATCVEFTVTFPGFDPGSAFLVFEDSFLSAIFGVAPDSAVNVPGPVSPAPKGGRSVLFFGRDDAAAGGIGDFLKSLGIETKTTSDIRRAMEWIASGPILVLADFSAGPDGAAGRLCREAMGKGKGIPVVGYSDRPTRETILGARRAGVRTFLVHPFTPESLREKMGQYLDAGAKV